MLERARQPLITVIIPSFNHAKYIEQCIDGVISQTYKNIELIIIDDGSSDDSIAKIEAMVPQCRKRFIRFEFRARPNKGLGNTLNEALEWANGDYLAVADSDDILLPEKSSVLFDEIEKNKDIMGVFGGSVIINSNGEALGYERPRERIYSFSDILERDKHITSSCGLMRLDAVRRVGGYRGDLYIEDWYMWLRLTETGSHLKTIPQVLTCYRHHELNMSKSLFQMFEARKAILDIYHQHRGHRRRMSAICLASAIDFSRISKPTSLRFIARSLSYELSSIFKSVWWNALARMLTPVIVLDSLKRLRTAVRREGRA
jgi:alpha-1,3-rhamnosyltransferase